MVQQPRKARTPREKPTHSQAQVRVQVPRDDAPMAYELTWDEVVALAEQSGWTVRTDSTWGWCEKGHCLLRNGQDEMKGIPVLFYQNW
jgi:hypothetical protein